MTIQSDLAPLNPRDLELTLKPFGYSRMLPPQAYVGQEVFDWERRNFFEKGWLCVGFSQDIAEPGDQKAETLGTGSVLLIRGHDDILRAFANVCSHRGHELLPCGETAHHGRIICPYHSWSYSLEGDVWTAPGFQDVEGFVAAEHGLTELPCTEWHGMIFVNSSSDAEPLDKLLAELDPIIAPYEPERLKIAGRHVYTINSNWKTLTENYHECYHCMMLHPQLCVVSAPQSGYGYYTDGPWSGGTMLIKDEYQTMSMDGQGNGAMLRNLNAEQLREVVYVNIFPNVLISCHPDYVMIHRIMPAAVGETIIECMWAFAPESWDIDEFNPAYAIDFWDLTNSQDWGACESVQRALASPKAIAGPLSSQEENVYQYVTMVARGYLGQSVKNVKETPVA